MKIILIVIGFLYSLFINAQIKDCQQYDWVKELKGPGYDIGHNVVVDNLGNSYIIGSFDDSITLGNLKLKSNRYDDIFVAKLGADGNFIWAKDICETNYGLLSSIAIDSEGNLYICGIFKGTRRFGDTILVASGKTDIFIAKLDNSGEFIWAVSAVGGEDENIGALTIDSIGNCYIIGGFSDSLLLGATLLISKKSSMFNFEQDVFITKLDTVGNFIWATQAGGKYTDMGSSIAIDKKGNCYITGSIYDTANFGNIQIIPYYLDGFVAKLNNSGDFIWVTNTGGVNSVCSYTTLFLDENENIFVTGLFDNTIYFGSDTLNSKGQKDLFVAKLNSDGDFLWSSKAGGSGHDIGHSITKDKKGNIYLVGEFHKTIDIGNTQLIPKGKINAFISKLDSNGNFIFSKIISSSEYSYSRSVALDLKENIYILGMYIKDINLDNIKFNSTGASEIYIAKFSDGNLELGSIPDKTIICGNNLLLNPQAKHFSGVSWFPTNGVSNSKIINPVLSPSLTTSYKVTINDNCGQSLFRNVVITVLPYKITTGNDTSLFCGSSIQLNALLSDSIQNIQYNWTPSVGLSNSKIANPIAKPPISLQYKVTANSLNGCTSSDSLEVVVSNPNPPPVYIKSSTGSFKICNNGLTLTATGYDTYIWNTGETTNSIYVNKPGWYVVRGIGGNDCAGIDSIEIISLVDVFAPNGNMICPGQAGQKIKLIATGGMDSYDWSTGEQTQSIEVTSPGIYIVNVKKGSCSSFANKEVIVNNGQASADFSFKANGLSITFEIISPSIDSISWDFGDGKTSDDENPTHVYTQSGNYNVRVIITDICNNKAQQTKTITVSDQINGIDKAENNNVLVFPNPANETINFDVSKVLAAKRILIYDINGKLVIEKNIETLKIQLNINQLSKGVYFYKIIGSENVNSGKFLVE